jgi:Ca-activated chloride channel family protein
VNARKPLRRALPFALTALAGALVALWVHHRLGPAPGPIPVDLTRLPLAHRLPEDLRRELSLIQPRALYLLALLPWFALWATRSLTDLAPAQRALSTLLRAALAALLVVALARPTSTTTSQRVCTVFVVDVSESVGDEALRGFRDTVESAYRARGEHLLRVVTFARRPRVVALPERLAPDAHLPAFVRHDPDAQRARAPEAGAGTDLGAALSLSYGLFPPGYLRRVVVLSDGVQTEGDALGEASRAARFGARVSVVPAREATPAEVAVRDLRLPDRIRVNEPFEVRATLFASRPARVSLTLLQGESVNGLDGTRTVDLTAGETELRFRSVVRVPGDVTYALRATPADPSRDRFRENNRFVAGATVPGRPTVLYVEGDPTRGQWLRAALAGGDFEVEQRGPGEFPRSLAEMERFDFIFLSDVGAESVSAGSQAALGRYLRELGGGFLMAGGARGFGLGNWGGTEMERLLPVRMESERRRDQPSLALALVIDRSGSMQGTPLALAQSAALATARALGPDDALEVIVFDTQPERVVRMQSARNRVRIENELRRIRPGGGTAIFPAMDAAQQDLALTRAVTRHVILLTDGQGQPDEPPRLRVLVDSMAADGITVSTVGLGAARSTASCWSPRAPRPGPELLHRRREQPAADLPARDQPRVALAPRWKTRCSPAWWAVPRASLRELRGAGFALPLRLREHADEALPRAGNAPGDRHGRAPPGPLARGPRVVASPGPATSRTAGRWSGSAGRGGSRLLDAAGARAHAHSAAARSWGPARRGGGRRRLRASVDVITDDDRFENGLVGELVLRGPLPSTREDRVPMRQVGPGALRGRGAAWTATARSPSARSTAATGACSPQSRGRADNPYPREYAVLEPDEALLAALARATGGRVDPRPSEMFAHDGERVSHRTGVWKYPVAAVLALLLLDLLLRRVRVLDRDFRGG